MIVKQSTLPICFLLLVSLLLFITVLSWAQDVEVTASVGADEVGVQENFQFTIRVSGRDSDDAQAPRFLHLPGFQVVAGPNIGTQFQWTNGRSSRSKSFTYVLLPEKEGEFTIEPVEVQVGSKIYTTQPVKVLVTSKPNRPPRPRRHSWNPFGPFDPLDPFRDDDVRTSRQHSVGNEVFVAAELDRTSVYPGQQVTLSYVLYTQISVSGLQLQESPPLTGFWVEDLDVEKNPTPSRRTINGEEYLAYVIKKQALFPNAPGALEIPPSTFAVSVKINSSVFSILGQTETVYRKTRPTPLDVKKLPSEGKPEDFSNVVGSYNLTSSVDKTEVATGDAVSLKVRLSGRGNLKMISDLPLPALPDFTIYSSKRTENVRPFEGDLIGGDKIWEYVIVPKAPGQQEIPPFVISYFDPEKGKYETVRTLPLTLKVARGSGSGATTELSGISKQVLTRQGTDIRFIKLSSGDLAIKRDPIHSSWWFYVVVAIPLLFNVGAFIYQRERAREAGNVPLLRSRKARRLAMAGLKKAARAGKAETRRFYDLASGALSGYLADRFNLPEIAVTGDMLERALAEHSIEPDSIAEAVACLQECDFGRFVSSSGSPEQMRALAKRIRKVIDTLG